MLSKLIDISEDLGIEDLAEDHDFYLCGKAMSSISHRRENSSATDMF